MPDDAERLIQQTRAEGGVHLSLNHCGLRELPTSLRQLTGLRVLELRENAISVLPDWLGELSALTALDLAGNGVAGLPGGHCRA